VNESQAAGAPWNVSLHGGHSSDFCDHAYSPLKEMVKAAVKRGMPSYGFSEHAPRMEDRFLYPGEREMGWDVEKLRNDFDCYAATIAGLVDEYAEEIEILKGFEIEVVPSSSYVELMSGFREQYAFDYIVGSVHYTDEDLFDLGPESFQAAVERQGGLERFAVRYYELVAEMVTAMKPEVVAHLDVIRKYAPADAVLDTPRIRRAAENALEAVRENGGILDINTGALRKGLHSPFPAPWIVDKASIMGIPFCFGDDSHRAEDVGAGIVEARDYLLSRGVTSVTVLTREDGEVVKRKVELG
jgi:histidinol-phosphatase (PHP family)